MKIKLWLFGLCALLCVALILPMASQADFGSFAGDSDYGDFGDFGDYGGYDSDYGSSWGSDSDWGGDGDPLSFGTTVFVFVVVLLWVFLSGRRKKRQRGRFHRTGAGGAGPAPSSDTPLLPLDQYTVIDPLFSRAALSEQLANLYVKMQSAWQEKHIESMRPYLTDALYTQMERQLNTMRQQGRTNYIDRIAVLGVDLLGYYQSGGEDHIVARLRTRIVDYTLDDKTGRLVSGDQRKERFMTYEWNLVRPTGTVTLAQADMHHVNCPNCGAPLSINQSAKCSYCGTVVTLSDHDWVIYAIKGISQQTG